MMRNQMVAESFFYGRVEKDISTFGREALKENSQKGARITPLFSNYFSGGVMESRVDWNTNRRLNLY